MQSVWHQQLNVNVELSLEGAQSVCTYGFTNRTKTKAPCAFLTKDYMTDKKHNFPVGYASTNTSVICHCYHLQAVQARGVGGIPLPSPTLRALNYLGSCFSPGTVQTAVLIAALLTHFIVSTYFKFHWEFYFLNNTLTLFTVITGKLYRREFYPTLYLQ